MAKKNAILLANNQVNWAFLNSIKELEWFADVWLSLIHGSDKIEWLGKTSGVLLVIIIQGMCALTSERMLPGRRDYFFALDSSRT
jgi:hypothetical protein